MYWITIDTGLRDNPEYMACSRSARLTYYELMGLCGRKETDALNMTAKQVGGMLGISATEANSDLTELIEAGLVQRNDEGQLILPDMTAQIDKLNEKRDADKRRQDDYKRRQQAQTHGPKPDNTQTEAESQPENARVTHDSHTENEQITAGKQTSKVKISKDKKSEVKISEEGFAQSANPPESPQKSDSASSKKSEAEKRRGEFFAKIAAVCMIPTDSKQHARSINAAAVWFVPKQISPDRLDDFSAWWFANDWRGLKGEYPKPDQIVSEWPKFELGVTAKKTTQPFAARQTKGEMQMSNIQAGINAFLAGGDN